ncbi:hypothetical protein F511_40928 [Dorcoceras hygrometricum]|uniref:Uncharacterized protein n=1 Tax=Dorcoceras hygrometricum TaxID=472368 RepID=A0A2Z7ARL2_9LAMI|nr:hypothetical protein F511_40928 [Dorcoceras hygrometricum]
MASSLISNSHHIDFDSVFDMDDAGLAQVFETLIATGLRNFLGPAVFYEEALLEFFANGTRERWTGRGTVDNQLREAFCVESIPVAEYTSRRIYQSQRIPVSEYISRRV